MCNVFGKTMILRWRKIVYFSLYFVILWAFKCNVVKSTVFIADKGTPVTKISCLDAHLNMECDLKCILLQYEGIYQLEKSPQIYL